jgi:hypothetical protein
MTNLCSCQDFFIDLIFAPVEEGEVPGGLGDGVNSASQRRDAGVVLDAEDKDNYDAMLHRDTRSETSPVLVTQSLPKRCSVTSSCSTG